jgi:hypothetical protein
LETYFLPLLKGLNGECAEFFVGQITNGSFTSSSNSSNFVDLQNGQIVRIGRGKRVITLLRALLLLKKYVKQQDSREFIVIYRSIGGALIYLFMKSAGVKFKGTVYDSDGLAIQERIETKVWRKFGAQSLLAKTIELFGINAASKILVRSSETISQITSRRLVFGMKQFCLLSNGRDTDMFSPETREVREKIRAELGFGQEDFILIYAGTIGDQYMIPEMKKVFEKIKAHVEHSKFLILTYAQDEVIEAFFGSEESRLESNIYVQRVAPDLVGRAMCIGDVGLSMRLILPSMDHVAPLKYREYLLAGVPVIYSGNTGDPGIKSNVVARELDPEESSSYLEVANWVSANLVSNREEIRFATRNYGLENFDILKDSIKLTKFLIDC